MRSSTARSGRRGVPGWLVCLVLGLGVLTSVLLTMVIVHISCTSLVQVTSHSSAADQPVRQGFEGILHRAVCRRVGGSATGHNQRVPEVQVPVQLRRPQRTSPPPFQTRPSPPPLTTLYINPDAVLHADEDGVELPKSDDDIERILNFPHVDECNLCRVCVPHAVVARHPKAQARAQQLPGIFLQDDLLAAAAQQPDDSSGSGFSADYGWGVGSTSSHAAATADTGIRGLRVGNRFDQSARAGLLWRNDDQGAGGGAGGVVATLRQRALQRAADPALGMAESRADRRRAAEHSTGDPVRLTRTLRGEEADGWSSAENAGHGGTAQRQQHLGLPFFLTWASNIMLEAADFALSVFWHPWRGERRLLDRPSAGTGGWPGSWPEPKRKLLRASRDARGTSESERTYVFQGRKVNISDIAPGDTKAPFRRHLPNCTVCWGCKHTLERMASGEILFGSYYAHEPGGSPSWLFKVRTNKTDSGWAVVKVWCVPVHKAKQRGLAMCLPKKVYSQVKLLLAQQQLTAKCGLNEIVPKLWVEPVHGVLPGHGFRVDWLGMWFDVADGVSVQNLQEAGKPPIQPNLLINMLSRDVNHTEVKLGAIFDLLFSQCDRHQQNIFVTAKGELRFIDNDQVYGTAWRKCGIDSMIIPTTQKYMINMLGFGYVMKYPHKAPGPPTKWSPHLNPLLMLDYRCHAGPEGVIGTNFPSQVKQCMADLAGMTTEQILWRYGYPTWLMADALRNRSRDMLENGYEWTLLHGEPTNLPMQRYKLAPPCCNMTWDERTKYSCTTPGFFRMAELPYGNPWHGGRWHGAPGKDTGTYEGGTDFEPKPQQPG